MNTQKKKTSIVVLIGGIFMLLLGFALLADSGKYMLSGKATDLNMVVAAGDISEYKGEHVSVDVDAVFEQFAETKHTWNGIPTGKDKHFLIWLDDGSVIAAAVPGRKAQPVEDLIEQTRDYINGISNELTTEKVHLEGTLQSMGGELQKYYDEVLDEIGAKDADLEIRYYQVDCTNSRLMLVLETLVLFGLGIVLVASFFIGRSKKVPEVPTETFAAEETPAYDPYVASFEQEPKKEETSGYEDPFASMRGEDQPPFEG